MIAEPHGGFYTSSRDVTAPEDATNAIVSSLARPCQDFFTWAPPFKNVEWLLSIGRSSWR
jgi:hypothetical protein